MTPPSRRLNVGCGAHHRKSGWINADVRPFDGVDLVMDAARPWPVHGLTHVYAEHFLEHLRLDQALDFLLHAGTALVPGGRLRLSTPNLEWVIRRYFPENPAGEDARIEQTLKLNLAFHGWGHQFLWTEVMLVGILGVLGYEHVEPQSYGVSADPVLAGAEEHGNFHVDHGHASVVIVEAVRGECPPALDAAIAAWLEDELLAHVRAGH